jgi:D-alanyl-lipoteichoic acid acyltransferase DltB (MBOAT superfamily)
VFTFVAVWHDISLKLLAWGWLISLFILPEIIATKLARPYRTWTHYRHLAAIGAVFNIIMMMVANLVGFAVGLDGVQEMIKEIFTLSGGLFVVTTFMCIFAAVHVMFEIRENEKRTGMLEANY